MRVLLLLTFVSSLVGGAACGAEASKSIYETKARSRLEALSKGQANVKLFQSITNLPASVRGKLVSVADAGQPFSKGCTGSGPHRRFLAATRAGRTYNVAIEQGGYVYTWFIVQFAVDEAGKVIREAQIKLDGAANRSQPVHSETNRTPAAAGSARWPSRSA
jgi:hypothetical protein